ncbi:MAG: metallophosphoesterase family protein [Elusimicrobia bacterium]|nr:metallophosphoesterase family protein [Elusimicrobiota bacterium]
MKIGIISDAHGNLEALTTSILFLKDKTDFLAVLGDTVGYGPNPEECINVVVSEANLILKGNHEEGIITGNYRAFKEAARIALEWTEKILSDNALTSIKNFKEKDEMDDVLFVHASISSPLFKYILIGKDAKEEFALLDKSVCFFGHTHMPVGYRKNQEKEQIETIPSDFSGRLKIEISPGYKYLINVGSTGQPRDGFPFACVSVYDTEKRLFNLYRIEYPVETTRQKILDRGLPSILARRVYQGI